MNLDLNSFDLLVASLKLVWKVPVDDLCFKFGGQVFNVSDALCEFLDVCLCFEKLFGILRRLDRVDVLIE